MSVSLSYQSSSKNGFQLNWSYTSVGTVNESVLTYYPKSGGSISSEIIDPSNNSVDLTNLLSGTEYLFTLQITNTAGNVYYSNTLDATTPMLLSTPTILSSVSINNGFNLILQGTTNILTSNDVVEFVLAQGSNLFTVAMPYSSTNTYSLTSANNALIRNYMSYVISCYFQPSSTNVNYSSASSMSNSVTVVPSDLPNQAQNLSVTVSGNYQASLSWSQPSDFSYYSSNFSVLVGYSLDGVNYTTTNLGQNVNSTSYVFSNLSNANYTFEVIYINQYGQSTPSTISINVYGLPSAPSSSSVVGDTQITLNWTDSTPNNGSAILSYNVYLNGNLVSNVSSSTFTYSFTGLTNGLTYNVSVSALNILGEGSLSTISNLVPNGNSSLSNVVLNGKTLTFTFTPNGSAFQNAYVMGMDSTISTSDPPIIKNILANSLSLPLQSQITGSFTVSVDFSSLGSSILKYFVVASSQNNSSYIDNIGV